MLEIYFERNQDLYFSTRASLAAPWSAPQPATELNSTVEEMSPELTPDGLTIYFSSARASAALDVFVATRVTRTGPWSVPVLVSQLSSTARDLCPAVVAGDLVMVLDSDRDTGGGARHLYLAARSGVAQPWGTPSLLTSLLTTGDVKTAAEDSSAWLDASQTQLYFSSLRGGADQDLWVATRS